ncbi:helix-turn-helix domain-containing protein [Kosakonia oryziphila]|uniref:Helix-turn-helix n=1 Tax=Kosakonia oryziphila TaxID=1005667 RepID=A0A1C4G9Z0_9ENTR|nr:helix-turn-helix domain-containing protein [Kosakonia oryziphila]SCC64733.1 Helix-turn-helix [Kosakonia oryziphila]
MSAIQFITDSNGHRVSAVVPIELFEKLTRDSDLDELYEPVQFDDDTSPDTRYPNEVINILSEKNCTMQAAWRIYRGMTQKQVADALGITQATVSEFEKSERPRRDNIERLAKLYRCTPEQLILE